ncbi:hypothetical protein [Aeromonas phage AS-szw]|nr:hypothetical protein [Aeromonas phage AS-szw]
MMKLIELIEIVSSGQSEVLVDQSGFHNVLTKLGINDCVFEDFIEAEIWVEKNIVLHKVDGVIYLFYKDLYLAKWNSYCNQSGCNLCNRATLESKQNRNISKFMYDLMELYMDKDVYKQNPFKNLEMNDEI